VNPLKTTHGARINDLNAMQWFSMGLVIGELMRVVNLMGSVINNTTLSKKIQDLASYSYKMSHEVERVTKIMKEG